MNDVLRIVGKRIYADGKHEHGEMLLPKKHIKFVHQNEKNISGEVIKFSIILLDKEFFATGSNKMISYFYIETDESIDNIYFLWIGKQN